MNSFWSDHWWAIPLWLAGVAVFFAVAAYARRNPNATASKVIFLVFPLLNPQRLRPSVAPWAMWLVIITMSVLIVMSLLEQ